MDEKLNQFLEKMIHDMGSAASAPLVIIGDRLGLYKALDQHGPLNSQELAEKTGTHERYIREWLAAQAASGYISYDTDSQKFHLSPEQKAVFADENSPMNMTGGFYSVASIMIDEPKITDAFRTGEGVGWHDHHDCLFCGTAKFFRPGYLAHITQEWIPSLNGTHDVLHRGAKVADVGCGYGVSTLIMAREFPHSQFYGFDYHEKSIHQARANARESGLKNVFFETATAQNFPGNDYDVIAFFDCLHDMGDPVGAVAHARRALKPDGALMIIEPYAEDEMEKNLNPVGRLYYAFSTMVCTPASLSQDVRLGLGAQAGEKRLREVVTQGGFTQFRRASQTPFNLVLEARP
ncbi:MAG: class I SAM-dependent methyltransferase [bacterium]